MKKIPPLILILLLMKCSGCDVLPTPKEELPPITQEGKNTFGCLVNGKVWLPKGNNETSNLDLSYDPLFNKGTFDLRTYRYPDDSNWNQYFNLFSDSISSVGNYPLLKKSNQALYYSDSKGCNFSTTDKSVTWEGQLIISKFDLSRQIIAGTFEFKIYKPDCDTIKVTQGRFDLKF
jgi:hypothetical protein